MQVCKSNAFTAQTRNIAPPEILLYPKLDGYLNEFQEHKKKYRIGILAGLKAELLFRKISVWIFLMRWVGYLLTFTTSLKKTQSKTNNPPPSPLTSYLQASMMQHIEKGVLNENFLLLMYFKAEEETGAVYNINTNHGLD